MSDENRGLDRPGNGGPGIQAQLFSGYCTIRVVRGPMNVEDMSIVSEGNFQIYKHANIYGCLQNLFLVGQVYTQRLG